VMDSLSLYPRAHTHYEQSREGQTTLGKDHSFARKLAGGREMFFTLLGNYSSRSDSFYISTISTMKFGGSLSENLSASLGYNTKEKREFQNLEEHLENVRLETVHRTERHASTIYLKRRGFELTQSLRLKSRPDTVSALLSFDYSKDSAGRGDLHFHRGGLKYRIGSSYEYSAGVPVVVLSADSDYFHDRSKFGKTSVSYALQRSDWHIAGKLTADMTYSSGNRLGDANKPRLFRSLAFDPALKAGVWRYIDDLSAYAKVNVKISPNRNSVVLRSQLVGNFESFPQPILQASYDSATRDVVLSVGIKL